MEERDLKRHAEQHTGERERGPANEVRRQHEERGKEGEDVSVHSRERARVEEQQETRRRIEPLRCESPAKEMDGQIDEEDGARELRGEAQRLEPAGVVKRVAQVRGDPTEERP